MLLQADLTAVAPGPLEAELARTLHLVADVESRGGATVYRFTPGSVRRAFDAGWTALEVHDFVGSVSRTPVPQPLTYLVDDVSRTFGTVRVGQAESFLRADDESALTELLHHPKAGSLGLRRIAPDRADQHRARRRAPPPAARARRRPGRRGPGRDRAGRAPRPAAGPASARRPQPRGRARPDAGRGRRRGDRHPQRRPRRPRRGPTPPTLTTTPTGALTALREAIEAGSTVVIGYVDNHGARSDRVVDPLRLEGGSLTAHDHRADDVRAFAVHRITSVAPLPARP